MSLLRFGGKDPQGNAKGVSVDNSGSLMPSISTEAVRDFVIDASGQYESLPFHINSEYGIITARFGSTSVIPKCDVIYTSESGKELFEITDLAINRNSSSVVGSDLIHSWIVPVLYSNVIKVVIKNPDDGNARTLRSLQLSSLPASSPFIPKHHLLSVRDVTIPAEGNVQRDQVVQDGDGLFRRENQIITNSFAFFYVSVETVEHDNGHALRVQQNSRWMFPETAGRTVDLDEIINSTSRRVSSDWIEVKGGSISEFSMFNNDSIERNYTVSIFGVR